MENIIINKDLPFTSIKIKPFDDFVHKVGMQIAENFDNDVMAKILEIAKEQGYTDLFIINKEFVAEALKREIERRKKINRRLNKKKTKNK